MSNDAMLFLTGLTQSQLDAALAEESEKLAEKQSRHDASQFHCCIPDWTGQGGMQRFWVNEDGTYESMDSRNDDAEIRRGLRLIAER